MMTRAAAAANVVQDLVTLAKPRVTALVMATTAGGLWMAPSSLPPSGIAVALLGVALLVAAANAFNMFLERETDGRMKRTMERPLPAGRLAPATAVWFGAFTAVTALSILSMAVNALTALLGLAAFIAYVLFYTPLKQKTTAALLIGAVPGAMPPLMGWTAATGSMSLGGANLFAILFLWQIPHFLAIALYNREEYEKAGIRVLPLTRGVEATKNTVLASLSFLIPVTLMPVNLGLVSDSYFWTALIAGLFFFGWGCWGLRPESGDRWARSFFLASIVYLPVLFLLLLTARLS